jgi:hypothetical protein
VHGGSAELDNDGVLVVGLLDVVEVLDDGLGLLRLGLLSVLGLLVLEEPRPFELLLPAKPVDRVEPRGRVVLPTAFGLLFSPDGLLNPVDPGVVGLVNVGVAVVFREPAMAEPACDEPVGDVGEQFTPGVIVDDGVVGLVDLVVGAVPVVPVVPVLPLVAVVPVVPVRGLPVV